MRSIRSADVSGRRVLLRVDWNVPLEGSRVTDDTRIVESLTTIWYLVVNGARVIILSHLGRPEGKVVPELSLAPVVKRARDLITDRGLSTAVRLSKDIIGKKAEQLVEATKPGEILVLENIRFDGREEQNDPQFSAELAELGEVFINDAFATCHRAHASTVGVAGLLPSYAGFLVEKEVRSLGKLIKEPEHPFVVILGGAKPDDKIEVMENLAGKVDYFLVGGGIANTFLKVKKQDIKESLVGDDKSVSVAAKLLSVIGDKLVLPADFVWSGPVIKDVGPKTIEVFENHIHQAKTIFWNGTLGVAEEAEHVRGTKAVAVAVASAHATSVVGGGDTTAAIDKFGLRKHISFVSTGGGATLEFLAGKSLPGLKALGYGLES